MSRIEGGAESARRKASTPPRGPDRRPRVRLTAAERRSEIVRTAVEVFGAKGYHAGSLAEVAERVGLSQAGILHHFGSKDQLLIEMLEAHGVMDREDQQDQRLPQGRALFEHLGRSVVRNMRRAGIIQAYTTIVGESVTEQHPAQEWARSRYAELRELIVEALLQIADQDGASVDRAARVAFDESAVALVGLMDGVQTQWLLDPRLDLSSTTLHGLNLLVRDALAHVGLDWDDVSAHE